MNKSTIMVLFLLAITIFGATNIMTPQGAGAQNYYNNEQTYADHHLPSTIYGEAGNDNMYTYNNYYPQSPSTSILSSLNYPPDVTKFECQKGPFKGFLVSSPEFCDTSSSLTLMTWNIYQGADLSPLFNATTPSEFVTAVGSAYNRVQATNFVERADSIADEIQKTGPDLIGLQEVILLRTQIPSDGPATPATNISLDYLKILVDTLAERGLIYEPVVVQNGTDIEAPGLISTGLVDIRLTDRDVILARADRDFTLSNSNGAQFAAKLPLTTPFGPISIPRSWVSVDITFDNGDKARVVSTHLEPLSPIIQGLQADELLNGPGNTHLPVALIGDFNSNADETGSPTYTKLKNADFIDAWSLKGRGTGFTCCQADDLLNPNSSLTERSDLVMFQGNFEVKDIEIVGNSQKDRTISGLWPSDHAGIVASLNLNGDKY
ncbi:MAG TPA: endonuclease/exonuclease/phosphatase family protein [Nitrososphaeraceae archaeon]